MLSYGFRARCDDIEKVKGIASKMGAAPGGKDNQFDTYFSSPKGTLKVKESTLTGGQMVFYERKNGKGGVRITNWESIRVPEVMKLKKTLALALNIEAEITKVREIYSLHNNRILIDVIEGEGTFISLELPQASGFSDEDLMKRLEEMKNAFEFKPKDGIEGSYADIVLKKKRN